MEKKLYEYGNGWLVAKQTQEQALEYSLQRIEDCKNYSWAKDFAKSIDDVKEVATPFKAEKKVYDAESFSEYCSELLDSWLEDINKTTYVREITEDDHFDGEEFAFVYTSRGANMVERAISRLYQLGVKHFGEEDIEIKCSQYVEM